MKNYDAVDNFTAMVLDDDSAVREMILDCLIGFAHFNARGFSDAEKLLCALFDPPQQTPPDLLVVDLRLEPGKMQGIELLAQLVERDIPSEILAISGADGNELEQAIKMGIVAVARKPFDSMYALTKKMEYMAEIGRKRRTHRLTPRDQELKLDANRKVRPLFLSYANQDRSLAMGLRRNLESRQIPVWYAFSSLHVGDDWRSSVDEAINKATCFIALISDSYVASPYCLEELTQFRHRKLNDHHSQLTIFPVLSGASEQSTNHKLIRPVIDNYQYINMDVHFIDGVTALLGRIQTVLGPQFYGKIYARFAGAGS